MSQHEAKLEFIKQGADARRGDRVGGEQEVPLVAATYEICSFGNYFILKPLLPAKFKDQVKF